jgi:sortase A
MTTDVGGAKTMKRRDNRMAVDVSCNKRRRKRLPRWADRLITVIVILVGVGLMVWPWVFDRLEASGVFNQINAVSSTVDALPAEEREQILLQARAYNELLAHDSSELPAAQVEPYENQLIFDRDPMMSWVEIPSINVSMPIYHGTSEEVLMAGVGHLEGTSLPVGGMSSHCVLTAHSGMRNLSIFDDIHALKEGDLVLLHTMGQTLAYKVVGSEVVWSDEVESLAIEPGADKLTLVTCTPYGVNDHRLFVHCDRTEYVEQEAVEQKGLLARH